LKKINKREKENENEENKEKNLKRSFVTCKKESIFNIKKKS